MICLIILLKNNQTNFFYNRQKVYDIIMHVNLIITWKIHDGNFNEMLLKLLRLKQV